MDENGVMKYTDDTGPEQPQGGSTLWGPPLANSSVSKRQSGVRRTRFAARPAWDEKDRRVMDYLSKSHRTRGMWWQSVPLGGKLVSSETAA